MDCIIVNATELRVNDYSVGSIPSLGFDFTALYYEPNVGNKFKFTSAEGGVYRVELLQHEIEACEAYCAAFVPPVVEPVAPVVVVDDPLVPFVDAHGFLRGAKPRSEVVDPEVEVPQSAVDQIQYHSTDMPVLEWNAASASFVGSNVQDRRLMGYYSEARFGDQLDALWDLVAALEASGVAIPAKTSAVAAILQAIKAKNPK